jgi:hypothetical protein
MMNYGPQLEVIFFPPICCFLVGGLFLKNKSFQAHDSPLFKYQYMTLPYKFRPKSYIKVQIIIKIQEIGLNTLVNTCSFSFPKMVLKGW